MMSAKRRDESGVYAVLFGILVLVLVSMAALAVDIGNAVARKSDVQGQADFAALGAAAQLEANSGVIPDAALTEARLLLNENRARNWGDDCSTGPMCIANNLQLTNKILADGEVRFANGGLQVLTPFENVDFGLAEVMGFSDHDVQGDATVRIGSYGYMSMPAYAVNPCDYGRQVLTDPASGHSVPVNPPPLAHDGHVNQAQLVSITPTQLAYDPAPVIPPTISVSGKGKLVNTTHVGFFSDTLTFHTYALPTPVSVNGNWTLNNIQVPAAVTGSEEVWYVRVLSNEANTPDPADDKWSASDEAVPLRIGNAVLECDSDVYGGNFGTIRMDRYDEEGEELARNFAEGFEDPIQVIQHQPIPIPGGECHHNDSYGSVESDEGSIGFHPDTDCLLTDPGLPANAATDGLIKGGSGFKGRLTDKPTRAGCDPSGGSSYRTVNVQGNYSINDEVLSCYMTNSTDPLSAIATKNYSGGPLLHSDIWDSPRFTFVPVLAVQPSKGLKRYSVIEMRPAFITDESLATIKGAHTATTDNGVLVENNDITQLTVIFFNINALPPDPDGDIIAYLGDGPKAIQLID
jgi:hypothetical protein